MSFAPRPATSTRRVDGEVAAFGLFALSEQATWTALLVVAYTSGGVAAAGVVSAIVLLPAAVCAPWVAHWAPRVTTRPVPYGYLVQAIAMLVCAVLIATGLSIVPVVVAAALVTVALTSSRPMHQSSLARRRDPDERLVATTASGAVDGAAKFLGPLVAAGAIVVLGPASVFVLGGVCLLVGAVLTREVRSGWVAAEDSPPGFWSTTMVIGRSRGVIAVLVALASATVLLGVVETVSTEMADVRLGSGDAATGLLLAAFGLGLALGGLTAAMALARTRAAHVLVGGGLLAAGGLGACGATDGPVVTAGALLLTGLGLQTLQVAGWVLLHALVPVGATAHVFALLESHQLVGNMVGAALAGTTVDGWGLSTVTIGSALALGLVSLVAASRVPRAGTWTSGRLDEALEAA